MGAESQRQRVVHKGPAEFLAEPFLFIHVQDQKAAGTDGGTFTQDAWQTRVLNTVVKNDVDGASLASNQITLPAGKYLVEARAPSSTVNSNRLRLRDTTGAATLLLGGSHESVGADSEATLRGYFELAAESDIELQHYCETTNADDGFGVASNLDSQVEVYAEVWLQKIA